MLGVYAARRVAQACWRDQPSRKHQRGGSSVGHLACRRVSDNDNGSKWQAIVTSATDMARSYVNFKARVKIWASDNHA